MLLGNEESFSMAIRQQGRLLEHPEDFEDDNDNDNYSDYVENVSVHAGAHIKSGVRWPAFIQIERAIAISKSPELNPDCLATQKPATRRSATADCEIRLCYRPGCFTDC
jgi:Zn-dependent metalloprotease